MFTSGFFNSMNGDRKYNAEQVSAIMDGLISDGIFDSIGDHFAVTPGTGMSVNVGTGRAWLNSTWSYNDSPYAIELTASSPSLGRIDLICIKVDHSTQVRQNSIVKIEGTPGSSPVEPTVTDDTTNGVYYHKLAAVSVAAGATSITAADITNYIGLAAGTPYVTGILETTAVDELWSQWDGEFNAWWEDIKNTLDEDVVTTILNKIDHITPKEATMQKYGFSHQNPPPSGKVYKEYSTDAILDALTNKIGLGDSIYLNGYFESTWSSTEAAVVTTPLTLVTMSTSSGGITTFWFPYTHDDPCSDDAVWDAFLVQYAQPQYPSDILSILQPGTYVGMSQALYSTSSKENAIANAVAATAIGKTVGFLKILNTPSAVNMVNTASWTYALQVTWADSSETNANITTFMHYPSVKHITGRSLADGNFGNSGKVDSLKLFKIYSVGDGAGTEVEVNFPIPIDFIVFVPEWKTTTNQHTFLISLTATSEKPQNYQLWPTSATFSITRLDDFYKSFRISASYCMYNCSIYGIALSA